MKRGLKLWSINTGVYLKEAEKLYGEGLFDYIELYALPESLDTLEYWEKVKIPFIIHCPHFAHGFNLAKAEKEESNLAIYKQVKTFADTLNAEYIIFHGGIDGSIEETARQLKNLKDTRALIENKPHLALLNRMGGKICRGYNVDEIKAIIDYANCGFCLDFGHAICAANALNIDRDKLIDDFLKLSPNMYHLTDVDDINSPYDTHLHLGEGQMDIQSILSKIPNDSIITFETDKNSKENLNDFKEDMLWLKKLI